jgi:UrcA family protein
MKTIIPLAMVGALMFAAPASAQTREAQTRIVYEDLDLGSARGVAELDRRIGVAVRSLCGGASDADVKGRNEVRRCREAARLAAAPQRDRAIGATTASAAAAPARTKSALASGMQDRSW